MSPRAARKDQPQPEPELTTADLAESQATDGPPGSGGPADWLAAGTDADAPEASVSGSATDWLAAPPATPDSALAPAPADWLAPVPDSILEPEPGPELEPGLEYGQDVEPEQEPVFEPGFEPELETDLASAAAYHAVAPGLNAPAYASAPEVEIEDLRGQDIEEGLEDEDEFEPELTLAQRLKRTPPALVILGLGALGSAAFMAYEVASHTAPVAVLTSAGVVTGLIYAAVAAVAGMASYRAATEGRAPLSYALAFVGGSAAIVACGSFAGALILFLAVGF